MPLPSSKLHSVKKHLSLEEGIFSCFECNFEEVLEEG